MILAICGLMKSGKDSFAKAFIDKGFKQINFATYLKEIASNLWEYQEERKEEYREALQWLGEGSRKYNANCWVTAWAAEYDRLLKYGINLKSKDVIVTDMRYMNEYNYLRELGATLISIDVEDPDVRIRRYIEVSKQRWEEYSHKQKEDIRKAMMPIFNHNSEIQAKKILETKPFNIRIEDNDLPFEDLIKISKDISNNIQDKQYLKEKYLYKEIV